MGTRSDTARDRSELQARVERLDAWLEWPLALLGLLWLGVLIAEFVTTESLALQVERLATAQEQADRPSRTPPAPPQR
jgi:hypothetical protein